MAWREWGNVPIFSTTAETTSNPSTASLVAELQNLENRNYEVRFCVGASTSAVWNLDHASSTDLSANRQRIVVFTGSNQSAEYIFTFRAERGDLFRVTPASSFTGTAAAKIQAEILT